MCSNQWSTLACWLASWGRSSFDGLKKMKCIDLLDGTSGSIWADGLKLFEWNNLLVGKVGLKWRRWTQLIDMHYFAGWQGRLREASVALKY